MPWSRETTTPGAPSSKPPIPPVPSGGRRLGDEKREFSSDSPIISIITPVLNGKRHLEETIKAVLDQGYDNLEYIIIDGGSFDGTLDIIRKYEDRIDYWISEQDRGIYNAMNKGIDLATGEIIGIINSDDWYPPGAVARVAKRYSPGIDIYYGDVISLGRVIESSRRLSGTPKALNRRMSFNHPTCFVAARVYKAHGKYDEDFRYAADYDLFLRLYKKGLNFEYIPEIQAHIREGGEGSSAQTILENYNIHCTVYGPVYGAHVFGISVIWYVFRRMLYALFGIKLIEKIKYTIWKNILRGKVA